MADATTCGATGNEEKDHICDPLLSALFEDLAESIKDFPSPEDFGCDEYSCSYNKETGHCHYTAYSKDSDSPARFSWDTDLQGNYIEGTAHGSWRGPNGEWEHYPEI